MNHLRVWAVGSTLVQYRSVDGLIVQGRYIARERNAPYAPLPEGEEVAETVEVLRDIRRCDLTTTPPSVEREG